MPIDVDSQSIAPVGVQELGETHEPRETAAVSNDAANEQARSTKIEDDPTSIESAEDTTLVPEKECEYSPMVISKSVEGESLVALIAQAQDSHQPNEDDSTKFSINDGKEFAGPFPKTWSFQSIDDQEKGEAARQSPPPTTALDDRTFSPPTVLVSEESNDSIEILFDPGSDAGTVAVEAPQVKSEVALSAGNLVTPEIHNPEESASPTTDITVEIKPEQSEEELPISQSDSPATKLAAKFLIPGLTYSQDNTPNLESITVANPEESTTQIPGAPMEVNLEQVTAELPISEEVLPTIQSIARAAISVMDKQSEIDTTVEQSSSHLNITNPAIHDAHNNSDNGSNNTVDLEMSDHAALPLPVETPEEPSTVSMSAPSNEQGAAKDATVTVETRQEEVMEVEMSPAPTQSIAEATSATPQPATPAPPKKRTPLPVMPPEFWAERKTPKTASKRKSPAAKKRKAQESSTIDWDAGSSAKPNKKSKIAGPDLDAKGKLTAPYLNHTAGQLSVKHELEDAAADFWDGARVTKRSKIATVEPVRPKVKKQPKITKAIVKTPASDKNISRTQVTIGTQTD